MYSSQKAQQLDVTELVINYLAGITKCIIKEVHEHSKHCYIGVYKRFKVFYSPYTCPYHQHYAFFMPLKVVLQINL